MSTADTVPATEDPPAAGRREAEIVGRRPRPLPAGPLPADHPDDLHPRHPGVLADAHDRRPDHGRPGRPARGPSSSPSASHAAGYDRPIIVQYLEYLGQIFTGNFGTTISDNRPVVEVLATYGAATLELAFYALIVAFIVGIPLGMLAAYYRDKAPDAVFARVRDPLLRRRPSSSPACCSSWSSPSGCGWLPVAGRATSAPSCRCSCCPTRPGIYLIDAHPDRRPRRRSATCSRTPCCPAIALGLLTAGIFLRLVRTNVIGTLATDYVDAARSRGVQRVPAACASTPTGRRSSRSSPSSACRSRSCSAARCSPRRRSSGRASGFQLAEYLEARDFVAVQGIVVLLAVIVALTNFIVDIIAALIDPRVRY